MALAALVERTRILVLHAIPCLSPPTRASVPRKTNVGIVVAFGVHLNVSLELLMHPISVARPTLLEFPVIHIVLTKKGLSLVFHVKNFSLKGSEWCRAGYNSHFTIVEGSHGREVPEYVPPEDETLGTCCYRGKTNSTDMCGTCQDVAKDSTCSVKSRCAGCGGTWCPGPRCVKAFKDEKNPCHSAFPVTGIAKADDFCSLNEKQCTNCKGAWCPVTNITYSDGTKYDPSHPYVPDSDQRLEPEDPKETEEAEEEVANDQGIHDLFPDGLA